MKCITLKQFCNSLGYYPGKKGHNIGDFAERTGVSISYISKIYNAKPVSNGGPAWEKLCTFVESYGYQLVTANPTDYMNNNITKENKKLKARIEYLENYIKLLELQMNEVQELIRVSKRISEYEEDKRGIKCKK